MIRFLKILKWKKIIERSGLFDKKFYLMTYEDVRKADMDPIIHYIKYGASEGRNPSQLFDTNYYLSLYPDVKDSGLNPLVHYILYGEAENRFCKPNKKEDFIKPLLLPKEKKN